MTDKGFGRRDFLKGAVVGGAAAAATPAILPDAAQAQQKPMLASRRQPGQHAERHRVGSGSFVRLL